MPLPKLLRRPDQRRVGGESARPGTHPAVVAVIGAVATAVATAFIGWGGDIAAQFPGGDDKSSTTTQGPTASGPILTAIASSREGAVSVAVPKEWNRGFASSDITIDHMIVLGPGINAGLGPMADFRSFDQPSLFLTTSNAAAFDLGFKGQPEPALVEWTRIAAADARWDEFASCDLVRQERVTRGTWLGSVVVWDGCLGREQNRHWELVAVDPKGAAIVQLSLNLSPSESEDVATLVLNSWSVDPEGVPFVAPKPRDPTLLSYPRPSWLPKATKS